MKDFMKRFGVTRWIADGAPVFWVLGIPILICGAALGILTALSLLLDWRFLAVAISWSIGALAVCFVACLGWFAVEALTTKERPTSWRKLNH